MGILRTDKISGLETPTAVTGSVVFDGSGDFLDLSSPDFAIGNADFTIETWYKLSSTPTNYYLFDLHTSGNAIRFQFYDGGSAGNVTTYWTTSTGTSYTSSVNQFVELDRWYHMAMTRKGTTVYAFMDGILQGTFTAADSFTHTNLRIGCYGAGTSQVWDGHISNFRIIKGTALYTSNFTPPVHALEPINGTVVLCCNNPDSARAASNAGIGTAHTITVTGNAAASTVSPGLVRDFTYGTQFEGVSRFDTQGYFVPPSGTTEQRYGGSDVRILTAGGYTTDNVSTIDFVNAASTGNATAFGSLSVPRHGLAACSSSTRGVFGGGNPSSGTIDFVTIKSLGTAQTFGTLDQSVHVSGSLSSNIRGIWGGGGPSAVNNIQYITIATIGNAIDFGDLSVIRFGAAGCSSSTRGVFGGGRNPSPFFNVIDFITISTLGNAQDFGDLNNLNVFNANSSCSSNIRGLFGGGETPATSINTIEFVTIASTGNAQDFGDLIYQRRGVAASSSNIRGFFNGGETPSNSNRIEYVTISSMGNGTEFGDLTSARTQPSACSNGHGGLS